MMPQSAHAVSLAAAKARSRTLLGRNLAISLLRGEEKNAGGSKRTISMASTAQEYLTLEDR